MSRIIDRYSTAINSCNLSSKEGTTYSDSDVLGAAGLAGKDRLADGRPGAPLGMALMRLFSGDNRAAAEIVVIMSDMAWRKAQAGSIKLRRVQADDLARAVLAWHRDGTCKPCGGHGYAVIGASSGGRGVVSDQECPACRGSGRVAFEAQFLVAHREIARWLQYEIEREQSRAGQAAMAALAPRLEL